MGGSEILCVEALQPCFEQGFSVTIFSCFKGRLHMQGNCPDCLECVISFIGLTSSPYQLQPALSFRILRLLCTNFLIVHYLTPYPEAVMHS